MEPKPNSQQESEISKSEEYLKKEADKLNKELEGLLNEARLRERYSLTILAVVSAWTYSQKFMHEDDRIIIKLIGFIPFVIVVIYALSVKHIYSNVKWIGEYLTRIENYFLKGFKDNDGILFGWERYFGSEDKKRRFVKVTYGFWLFQMILALISGFIVFFN